MSEETDTDNVNIVESLQMFVDDDLSGTYTASACIVEEIDRTTRRIKASLKEDEDVIIANIPVATPFAESGGGVLTPLKTEQEGILLHTREPLRNSLAARGHVENTASRHHNLENAVFFPRIWLDPDTVPVADEGEYKIVLQDVPRENQVVMQSLHPDGRATFLTLNTDGKVMSRMDLRNDGTLDLQVMDAGTPQVTASMDMSSTTFNVELNQEGMNIALGANAVILGDATKAAKLLNEEAVIKTTDDTFLGLSGNTDAEATIKDPGCEHSRGS